MVVLEVVVEELEGTGELVVDVDDEVEEVEVVVDEGATVVEVLVDDVVVALAQVAADFPSAQQPRQAVPDARQSAVSATTSRFATSLQARRTWRAVRRQSPAVQFASVC